MRQRLHRQLESLEVASASVRAELERERERANRPDPKEKIKLFLRVCQVEPIDNESMMETWARALGTSSRELRGLLQAKVEQMPNESMMETWARALGISSRELRSLLQAGIDPIHKYLKETGLLGDLKRKKAAAIMLSGSRNRINATV